MCFPSRAAARATETDGAKSSEQAKVGVEKRPRPNLPSTLEGSAPLSYAVIDFLFVAAFFLAMMFRIGVHLHILNQATLGNPTLIFHISISLYLISSLYTIIRLRRGRYVLALLAWI